MYQFCKVIAAGILIAAAISNNYAVEEHTDYRGVSSDTVTAAKDIENINPGNDGAEQTNLESEISGLVNNDQAADELIKTVYKKDELKPFIRLGDAMKEQPPECVRKSNDMLYLIYKYEGDNYLFLMYNSEDKNAFPVSSWYLGKKMYCEDFENLAERKASFKEIQEFDPYGDYTSYYASVTTKLYSLHHTVDGYLIRLEYSHELGAPLVVDKITKLSGQDNPIYYNLLEVDRELVNKASETVG